MSFLWGLILKELKLKELSCSSLHQKMKCGLSKEKREEGKLRGRNPIVKVKTNK